MIDWLILIILLSPSLDFLSHSHFYFFYFILAPNPLFCVRHSSFIPVRLFVLLSFLLQVCFIALSTILLLYTVYPLFDLVDSTYGKKQISTLCLILTVSSLPISLFNASFSLDLPPTLLHLLSHDVFRPVVVLNLSQLQDLNPSSRLDSFPFYLPRHVSPSSLLLLSPPPSAEFLLGLSLGFALWQAGAGSRPNLRPQRAGPLPPAGRWPHAHFLPPDVGPAGGRPGRHSGPTLLGVLCGAWVLPGQGERKSCLDSYIGLSSTSHTDSKWMGLNLSVCLSLAGGSRPGDEATGVVPPPSGHGQPSVTKALLPKYTTDLVSHALEKNSRHEWDLLGPHIHW